MSTPRKPRKYIGMDVWQAIKARPGCGQIYICKKTGHSLEQVRSAVTELIGKHAIRGEGQSGVPHKYYPTKIEPTFGSRRVAEKPVNPGKYRDFGYGENSPCFLQQCWNPNSKLAIL